MRIRTPQQNRRTVASLSEQKHPEPHALGNLGHLGPSLLVGCPFKRPES